MKSNLGRPVEYLQPTYTTRKKNEKFVYLKLKCNWVPCILSGCSSPTVRQRGGPGSPLPPALLPSETLPVPWKQAVGDVAPLACVGIGGL